MKQLYTYLLTLALLSGGLSTYGQTGLAHKSYRKAKKYYTKSDYLRAIPYLKEAVNQDPENANYAYKLGVATFEATDQRAALPFFIRAYNNDRNINSKLNFYLARSLHMNNKFEEAITHYQADLRNHEPGTKWYIDTQMRIKQCENGMKMDPTVAHVKIENLGDYVNTKYPEYSSAFAHDYSYMIYTSRRPRNTKRQVGLNHVEDINEEVYEATKMGDDWMKTKLFARPIPVWTHDASISITEDGNTLIYYEDKNYGDIFVSHNVDGKWSKKESIGEKINTKFNEPSIFISPDGEMMYYVSDKPGGSGMKDLYVSRKGPDGEWEEGSSMGSTINTEYDEDAPFLTPDGKRLFFSSRGHTAIGGYDVFYSDQQPDGSWSKPKNMGFPYCSTGEDIYFVPLDNKGENFFFSSDRPGGFGHMDIYQGSPFTPDDFPTSIAGVVIDEKTKKPVKDAVVNLVNPYTQEVVATTKVETGTGGYSFSLPECGVKYKLDVVVPVKEVAATNIPVETGAPNVLAGTVVDDVSKRPLEAVVEMVDPVSGKVMDQTKTNPLTGHYFLPVESGQDYLIRVKSNEYLPYYEEFQVSPTGSVEAHRVEIGLQRQLELNKFVITWQFFDVDKHVIKQDYYGDLDNVVEVLRKIPDMKLRVIGHTDSDADDDYNQKLSERRAQAVADYLISKGIKADRLKVGGEGEKTPLYDNTNPETKKWNRRVELFIED